MISNAVGCVLRTKQKHRRDACATDLQKFSLQKTTIPGGTEGGPSV